MAPAARVMTTEMPDLIAGRNAGSGPRGRRIPGPGVLTSVTPGQPIVRLAPVSVRAPLVVHRVHSGVKPQVANVLRGLTGRHGLTA